MDEINPDLIAEIRILLVAEESEFKVERAIINEVIYPNLRKYFHNEFNVDFNLIDAYQNSRCNNLPRVDKPEFLISEFQKCQALSNGLCVLLLVGEKYGELQPPKSLTAAQYSFILNFLQAKNDPAWIIFNAKYKKNPKSNEYTLEENIGYEEIYSLLNSIDCAINAENDVFPSSFNDRYFTSTLDKCLTTAAATTVSSTTSLVIYRTIIDSFQSKEIKVEENSPVHQKIKKKHESMIRLARKKFVQDNFIAYSVTNTSLYSAERDLKENPDKLPKIFDLCNFVANKSRLLTKDLRISSSFEVYLQIFIEHVMKVIRENSKQILLKREVTKSLSLCEINTHKMTKSKPINEDLMTIINRDREREMNIFENYLNSPSAKMPGLIFGPVGSGKTNLLFELWEKIGKTTNAILVRRQCGKTVNSSSLQLLLSSISQQINSSISKSSKQSQSCEYAVCVYEFWLSLNKSTPTKSIILLLDDVDNLFPSSHTDMVKWLPHSLPPGVKILLTASSDSFYQGFKRRYDVSNIINIPMIDSKEAIKLFNAMIESSDQTPIADNILSQACYVLQNNSTPLFISLLYWGIDFLEDPLSLTSDIKSLIKIYLKKLEISFSPLLFIHIFSYLSLSRFGLSLGELVDILSLDNRIMQSVEFDTLSRNGFQFPIYIVKELLNKCHLLLEHIQTSNRLLIRLRHRIYSDTIIEHYQLLQEDGKYFYQTLNDYWTSKYENDKMKSVFDKISETDELNTNEVSHIYLKRNVMSQPYYTINKMRHICSNERKLTELTNLLITFDKSNDLYRLVLFNFEYLFASLNHYGMNHLMSEMYFCRQVNEIKNNVEVELLLVQLRILSTDVINDAQLLAPELTGRLAHNIGSNTFLSYLHQHIDSTAPRVNTIISAIPSYPTIDIENIRVDMGPKNEIILSALSPDNRFISTIHFHKPSNEIIITVWDSRSATKSQIINLGLMQNVKLSFMIYVPQRDDLLIFKYEDMANKGFIIVNLEFSHIENTIKFPLKSSFKVEYLSKSHLYLNLNGEIQIFSLPSGQKDHTLSKLPWPTILTPSDKYLIGPKPPTKRDISENVINTNLRVMNSGSGEMLCQLSLNYNPSFLLANVRNEILFVSTKLHGIIFKYDIGQIAKKDIKKMKQSGQLKISEQAIAIEIKDLIIKYSPNIRGNKLQLSVDEKFLLAEYSLSDSVRIVAVWNLASKSTVLCNQISFSTTVSFSTDGQYFCYFIKNECFRVFNLTNSTYYKFEMDESPDQVYMLRSGSFFMTFFDSIKIASLKTLIKKNKNSETGAEFQPEAFHISLPKPKISAENVVLFSNDENSSKFLYYSLANNAISMLDVSHTNDSLTEFASDRFLSPDGDKLLLVFGFKLSQQMKASEDQTIEEMMLKLGPNGRIICNNNDYRKPQIPKENYFIGKTSVSNQNKNAFSQKIVKIINLKTSQTIFQVSLLGENILKLTDNILLTFKPDYASFTRSSNGAYDIVSIYHITEARFVSSLYIEHAVVESILIPPEKEKLLLCCGKNGKIIKILGGKYFSAILMEMDIQSMLKYYDEFARTSVVTKLFIFKENSNSILVQYSWFDPSTNTIKPDKEIHYSKVDLQKKEIICQFSSLGRIADVSNDGQMAVDSLLNIYELSKGSILRKLQNTIGWMGDPNGFDCTSLFSHDSSYIVTLDVSKGNLWVITNTDQAVAVGRALLASSITSNKSNKPFQMCLGLGDRVVAIYNDQEFKLFVIKMSFKQINSEVTYKSNLDRIKKLLYTN